MNEVSLQELVNLINDTEHQVIGEGAGKFLRKWSPVEKHLARELRLLTQRAADYEPPCPDCGKPMAEQRPGKYECLNPKCGS